MSIVTLLKDSIPAGAHFSYGTTFDHNIVSESDAWMYLLEFPLRGKTDFERGYTAYECVILVGKFSNFELEVNEHIGIIEDAEVHLRYYLDTIWKSSNILQDVRLAHVKNKYDANLSGARASFILEVPNDLCLPLP